MREKESGKMTGEKGKKRAGDMETKIRIPEQPVGAVSRKRLIGQFERSREEVIVLSAGAGFGKTTVMAEFARRHEGSSCWYQISGADNAPAYFFRGICSAILGKRKTKIPEIEETGQGEAEIREGCQRFLSFFDLENGENPFYVCIDDFQTISDERIYELVEMWMEYGRGKFRMLLTVRGSLPPFLAKYVLQGRVRVFSAEQLRFTESETKALVSRLTGERAGSGTSGPVFRYTGGWAAGIVLAGLKMKHAPSSFVPEYMNEASCLNDYIFFTMFRKLSSGVQVFLTDSSIFAEIEEEILNFVLGRSDAGRILEYLAHENIFLARRPDRQNGYFYYPVFASFLQSRLESGRREILLRRAAEYSARHEDWDAAAEYAMECGGAGVEILSVIVEKKIRILHETGKGTISERWISRLRNAEGGLSETTLYWLYRYLRYQGEEEQGMELLSKAMDAAVFNRHFERYAEYAHEQLENLRERHGPAPAKELAGFAEEQLAGVATSHSMRIVLRRLEYSLEMEGFAELRQFLKRNAEREPGMCSFHSLCRLVRWALQISRMQNEGASVWKEVICQSRQIARISKVYAEYGFYCAVCAQYDKKDAEWIKLAEEGIRIGGGGVFAGWMKLFLLLASCRKEGGIRMYGGSVKRMREEIRQIEAERIRMGLAGPVFHNEDLCILEEVLKNGMQGEKEGLLKVRCLGPLEAEGADGKVAWRTRKTKELFACLFYEGGRGVSRDTLTERLWPERDCKKATVLFHTTMSYLRKALAQAGAPEILRAESQTYALEYEHISSDIGVLMEWNQDVQKRRLPERKDVSEITSLYHECYMYGEDYTWLGGYREYVERIFLQTITGLADLKAERGDFGGAVLLLEKAAAVDRYAVPVAERLVEYLFLNGDIKEARKRYKKMMLICREEFAQELDSCFEDFAERAERRYGRFRGTEKDR